MKAKIEDCPKCGKPMVKEVTDGEAWCPSCDPIVDGTECSICRRLVSRGTYHDHPCE